MWMLTVHYDTADFGSQANHAVAGIDYIAAVRHTDHSGRRDQPHVHGRGNRRSPRRATMSTFASNLSAPTNATIKDGSGYRPILDDEPRITINDATVTEGNTGTRQATFTRDASRRPTTADVTVHYATARRHRHGRQRLHGRVRARDHPGRPDQPDVHGRGQRRPRSPSRPRPSSSTSAARDERDASPTARGSAPSSTTSRGSASTT